MYIIEGERERERKIWWEREIERKIWWEREREKDMVGEKKQVSERREKKSLRVGKKRL